jgi:spermidine synthase
MDLWYTRSESPGTSYCVKISRPLFSGEGERGRVDVFETEDFGRALAVEGSIVATEKDGFAYREMLVHVPLNVHPAARSVLVVGGGDGGALAELTRYPGLERVVVVEDDAILLDTAKRWFPGIASSFSDPRVRLEAVDRTAYVRDSKERFDLIVVDGCSGGDSFGQPFYCDCFRLLAGDGILVAPCGGAFFPARRRELVSMAGKLKRLFPIYRVYRVEFPSSEVGSRLIAFASKRHDPVRDFDPDAWKARALETRYYDVDMHAASFALPRYLRESLAGA